MSGRTEDESARWLGALNKIRKIGTTLLDQQLWCWGQDIRRADGNALLAYVLADIDRRQASTEVLLMSGVALVEAELFYGDSGFSTAMGDEEGFSYGVTNSRLNRQHRLIFRCRYGIWVNSQNLHSHVMWKRGVAFLVCSPKVLHG